MASNMTLLPRFSILLLVFMAVHVMYATTLHADGIIRVKGDNWRGTRITVVPEFSQPYDVDLRSPRFMLHLPLQSTYLVRAEHLNCPTKEIVFDLRVPAAAMSAEYEFPFEIILEVQPDGVELRYAGPVGMVSFDPEARDFDYITDHRLIAFLPKADELRERAPVELRPQTRPGATAKPVAQQTTNDHGVPLGSGSMGRAAPEPPSDTHPAKVEAPPTATDPDVEHQDLGPEATTGSLILDSSPALATQDIVAPPTMESITPAPPDHASAAPSSVNAHPGISASARVVDTSVPQTTVHEPCGTEETTVSGRMVIHVRRTPSADGGCHELRTVTHAYGGVFYFHDGRPVTESYFNLISTMH